MDQMDELDWAHKVVQIRERRTFQRRADAHACDVISHIFGDAQCLAMAAKYTIRPLAPGRYRVSGSVRAEIEQICGVTLDPVKQIIDEAFDVEFRSGARRDTDLEPDFDALADDAPEPVEQGEIRIGRFICEVVASAIDPFPRAADAVLEQVEAGDATPAANPFAALAQLKNDPKPS